MLCQAVPSKNSSFALGISPCNPKLFHWTAYAAPEFSVAGGSVIVNCPMILKFEDNPRTSSAVPSLACWITFTCKAFSICAGTGFQLYEEKLLLSTTAIAVGSQLPSCL